MKGRFLSLIGVAVTLSIGPALADEHATEEEAEEVCINTNLVRNFDGLDDQHVFVEERSKDYYLLTMKRRCSGLRHANTIALNDTTSRICSGGFGEIIFREAGIGRMTCRIDTIEPVENKDEARAIIDERKAYKKQLEAEKKAAKKKEKEMKKAAKEVTED